MCFKIDHTEEGEQKRNGQNWSRTSDTRIFSPLLYHLSYLAIDYPSPYIMIGRLA